MAEAVVVGIDRRRSRPFTLGDAMIFIIALALGLALARPAIHSLALGIGRVPQSYYWTRAGVVQIARHLIIIVFVFLLFLLPAFLIMWLRRPRPPLRSMMAQPGFLACAAPVAVFLCSLPLYALAPSGLGQRVIDIGAQVLLVAAVPLAWVCLIATHRWEPEPTWLDRLGRILGALWMVTALAQFALIHLLR